jgi:hypothetical protein
VAGAFNRALTAVSSNTEYFIRHVSCPVASNVVRDVADCAGIGGSLAGNITDARGPNR